MRACLTVLLLAVLSSLNAPAQRPFQPASAEILQKIRKLNVLGSVLYFAAHPDDENTALIAYMANEKLYRTSYLSLTRGDGGQNLIGPEMRSQLGMIRTQELLQARRIDGGIQYFSRANDFGFSKNPDETFEVWDKEKVLADAVWIIRNTRPDVIVTRFPPDARAGHGHHTASALLAEEAFQAAGDPRMFPEQLQYVSLWKPVRLLWNVSMWAIPDRTEFVRNAKAYLKADLGGYNAVLGKSYGELAAQSRSMHKSQGFGAMGRRGSDVEYFQHVTGEKSTGALFEGIDTSWDRVPGGRGVALLVDKAIREYDMLNPAASVAALFEIRKAVRKLPEGYWKPIKQEEVDILLKDVLGLYMEATTAGEVYAQGERIPIQVEAINRSMVPAKLAGIRLPFGEKDSVLNLDLKANEGITFSRVLTIPPAYPVSQPYWLQKEIGYGGLFEVNNQKEIGLPEDPAITMGFDIVVNGDTLSYQAPVQHKRRDPVKGEIYQPLYIGPPLSVETDQEVFLFASPEARTIQVRLKAGRDKCEGSVRLELPPGWRSVPEKIPFLIASRDEEKQVSFSVLPPGKSQESTVKVVAEMEGRPFSQGKKVIAYDHIPTLVYFPEAVARLVRLDLKKAGSNIGYISGAGDAVPQALRQVGYHVTLLDGKAIAAGDLKSFDAIITGVRAYNTNPDMLRYQEALFAYVRNGGTLVVQYNTGPDVSVKQPGPYPFEISRDRVAVEGAEVRIINPASRVLQHPNRITPADFDGWVQERGLYFPKNWDPRYETVISSNDPGSPALDGGILVAKYGKGHYVYTSLSWFRQLPAGVPGAYRLFTNLISLGK